MNELHKIVKVDGHIHILSDNLIEEGDWVLCKDSTKPMLGAPDLLPEKYKKILATTDRTLTVTIKGEGRNCDEFKFLARIPNSLVEYYNKHQPEEVELEYFDALHLPKLHENEVVWVKPTIDVNPNDRLMSEKLELYTRQEVENKIEEYREFAWKNGLTLMSKEE